MIDQSPLQTVSDFVRRAGGQAPVATVFDLDSTLFCVSPRTRAILRQLAAEPRFKSQFETHAESLKTVEVLPSDWGVREVILRSHPEGPAAFFREVRDYWRRHFFSSHFLDHDEIYPYADEYVRHLQSLGAEVFYLTGRPEQAMRQGTIAALAKFGFPQASPGHLLMKPSDVETDEHFKTVALRSLAGRFEHIWFFENEPVIIEQVRAAVPKVGIVFVDSVHSGRAEPPSDLPKIGMSYAGPWRD